MDRRWNHSWRLLRLLTVRYHVGILLILHEISRCFQFFRFSIAIVPTLVCAFLLCGNREQKGHWSEWERCWGFLIVYRSELPRFNSKATSLCRWSFSIVNEQDNVASFHWQSSFINNYLSSVGLLFAVRVLRVTMQIVRECGGAITIHFGEYHEAQQEKCK